MSIAKDNKRILVTVDPATLKMLNNIIHASNNSVRTLSEAIKFSVTLAYSVLASYNDDTTKGD